MVAPGMLYRPCRRCGQYWKREMISRRGLCPNCAKQAQEAFQKAMREKSGPQWEAWLKGWKDAMARVLGREEERHWDGQFRP